MKKTRRGASFFLVTCGANHCQFDLPPTVWLASQTASAGATQASRNPYFSQPRLRKYQNGVTALASISMIANG